MRIAFAGTPPFAAGALSALAAAGHEIALVLTQPDRPAGRGMRLSASAVARLADELHVPVIKPASLRDPQGVDALRRAEVEVLVVAAYGLLLPKDVLEIPSHGCINIHASLLPRWRGAAPIQRAILAGDTRTGVSIMQMDAGLDTGPVLLEEGMEIGARATAGSLTQSLSELGARLIVTALESLASLVPHPQDPALATLAPKISKREALIDWRLPNDAVDRAVRAFNAVPGAETRFADEPIKVWEAIPVEGRGKPGEILEASGRRVTVACGSGALELRQVQRAGGKPMPAVDFARGSRLAAGAILGEPASTGSP